MKTFLKTLIGGALGVGAIYVVGKICYEAGKDVAEIERQLEKETDQSDDFDISFGGETVRTEHVAQIKMDLDELDPAEEKMPDESTKESSNPTMLGRLLKKVKNAKLFITAKKAFDKSNRSPGILSSLLTNPDGAKIEAYVRDGGVQISVKPRAA